LRHGYTRLERIAAWNAMQCGAVSVRPAVLPYELGHSAMREFCEEWLAAIRGHIREYTIEAPSAISLMWTRAKLMAADRARQTLLMGPKVL